MNSFNLPYRLSGYPRIQINKLGEIVLAIKKNGGLTEGILIGKTEGSKSNCKLGSYYVDWEVCGELEDYTGSIEICISNTLV
jgi:hypothetical protein